MGSLGNDDITKKKAMWLYPKVLGFNPSERWGHSACYSHEIIYIFGGCCGGMHFGDVLALDLKTMTWNTLVTTGRGPGPRDSHSAVLVGQKMIVFGGTNGTRKVNDLHILDLVSKEWTQPECKGVPPSPRESHTATLVGDEKLVLFGGSGEGEANYLNDLHVLDLKTMKWTSPVVKGDIPVPRDSHSAVAIGKRLFVYGGDCGDRYHGDVDMLDMDTLTWSRLAVHGSSPGVRAGHATVNFGTKIYIVGGVGDKRYYNDVWVLDVSTCSWTQLEIRGQQPQGRFSHTAIITDSDIAIYGGCGEDERPLDELLVLQLGSDHPNGRYNISLCKMFGTHWSQGKRRFVKESENNPKSTLFGNNNVEVVRKHAQAPGIKSKLSVRYNTSDTLHPKRRRTSNSKVWEVESEQEEHSLSLSQHSSPSQSDQEQTPGRKASDSVNTSRVFPLFKNQIQSPRNSQSNNVSSTQTDSRNMVQRTSSDVQFLGEHQNQQPAPKQFIRVLSGKQEVQQCVAEQKLPEAGFIQNFIGADVRGKVDGAFDSGYLMTATVNGKIFRGVLFAPASGVVTRGPVLDPNPTSRTSQTVVTGVVTRGPVLDPNPISRTSHTVVTRPYQNSNHLDSTFFKPSHQPMMTLSIPEQAQMNRPSPVIRTTPSSNREMKVRSDLQGVVLTLGGPGSGHGRS